MVKDPITLSETQQPHPPSDRMPGGAHSATFAVFWPKTYNFILWEVFTRKIASKSQLRDMLQNTDTLQNIKVVWDKERQWLAQTEGNTSKQGGHSTGSWGRKGALVKKIVQFYFFFLFPPSQFSPPPQWFHLWIVQFQNLYFSYSWIHVNFLVLILVVRLSNMLILGNVEWRI